MCKKIEKNVKKPLDISGSLGYNNQAIVKQRLLNGCTEMSRRHSDIDEIKNQKKVLTNTEKYDIIIFVGVERGRLAQLGERLPYKQDVGGSIPSSSTNFLAQ